MPSWMNLSSPTFALEFGGSWPMVMFHSDWTSGWATKAMNFRAFSLFLAPDGTNRASAGASSARGMPGVISGNAK